MIEKSQIFLKDIAAHAPGVIYQFRMYPDGHSCFPYSSPGLMAVYGVSPEEVVEDATAVFNTIHPDDVEGVKASILESAATLKVWKVAYSVYKTSRSNY